MSVYMYSPIVLKFLILLLAAHAQSCEPDECVKHPPTITTFPVDNQTIEENCRDYYNYKTCVDSWINKCMTGDAKSNYNKMTQKSMVFLEMLCTNESFKIEYHREKENLIQISADWNNCFKTLSNTLLLTQKDLSRNDSIFKICCATKEFQNCTNVLCNLKCTDSGKSFLRKIHEMMMSGYESLQCDKIPYYSHCSAADIASPNSAAFSSILNSLSVYPMISCVIFNLYIYKYTNKN